SERPADRNGKGKGSWEPRRSAPGRSLRPTKARRREARAPWRSEAAAPETRRAAHTWQCAAGKANGPSRRGLQHSDVSHGFPSGRTKGEFHWSETSLLDGLVKYLAR